MIYVQHALAPADRFPNLDPATRDLCLKIARKGTQAQAARDGWYRLLDGTEQVRRGMLPGVRKPWYYLETRALEVAR